MVTGIFWNITLAGETLIFRGEQPVHGSQLVPGFTVRTGTRPTQSFLTIDHVFQNLNATQLQCFLLSYSKIFRSSDIIQVLVGSMKQKLLVMLKCNFYVLNCRRS